MKEWMILAAILIPVLAAGIAVGIYFLVKALKAKAKAKAKAPAIARTPAPKPAPPAPKPAPPAPKPAPPAPKPAPPAPKSRSVLPAVPFVPDAPAKFVPSAAKFVPAQPPAPARTNCPKGRVPDPDNPSKLCKPSCRGADLGYAFWGPSGSCCKTIKNTDCISWDQISKINDDKVAAEQDRKRRIAEAAAAAEAERQKRAEAERQKQEAERQKRAEAERQKRAEAERQKRAEAERQKRAEAERQKQVEAERQKQEEAERQKRAEAKPADVDRKQILDALNAWRASQGSPALRWDEGLATAAQAFASSATSYGHDPNPNGAESIAVGGPGLEGALGSLRQMTAGEKSIADTIGQTASGPCRPPGNGKCGINGWPDGRIGHFCMLTDQCATRVGIGIAQAKWSPPNTFSVYRLTGD